MGANCCVAAAKDKHLPDTAQLEVSTYRDIRHSPSWSFQWDNHTHIEDIMDNHACFSYHNSWNVGPEIKSVAMTETEGFSDGGSPFNSLQKRKWHKSLSKTGISGKHNADAADQSIGSDSSPEAMDSTKSLCLLSDSDTKSLVSVPSTPSAFRTDPSSSRSRSLTSDSTLLRKARRSPGYQHYRQISDSRIPSLKSLNESSSPEGRQSFVLSLCGNEVSTGGSSHGGSSDGWSMRMFTELVASSRRERWYFDSENFSCSNIKMAKSNCLQSMPVYPEQKTCRICSKLLKEKFVVAVLVCGHVYHAECLEKMTLDTDKYDPPCPICTHGEKSAAKIFGKVKRAKNKISRIAVADTDVDQDTFYEHQKRTGKVPRIRASSSMKSSYARPFLRRHFSIGWPSWSLSQSESSRKKFWARYRRE